MQRIRAEYRVYMFDKVLKRKHLFISNVIKACIISLCFFYIVSGLWKESSLEPQLFFQVSSNEKFNKFLVEFFIMGVAFLAVILFAAFLVDVSWNNMLLYHYRNKLTPIKYCFIEFKEETLEYGAIKGRFLILNYKIIQKYHLKNNKLTIDIPLIQLKMDMSYFTNEEQERIEKLLNLSKKQ